MFIISIILMIGGAIAAVTGYISITAIHLDSIYGLFEVGLIALVIGFALFMYSLVKKINENKKVPVLVRKCPYCSEPLTQNEIYCHKCGKKTI